MPRNVLLCIDGSSCANYAFRWAAENFLRQDDHLILLHATRDFKNLEPLQQPGGSGSGSSSSSSSMKEWPAEAIHAYEQKVEEQARLLVQQYTASHLLGTNIKTEAIIQKGDPRQIVLDYVDKYKPVAVIMGSRGLGLLKRTVLGSVSDYILHNCDAPVIVIREVADK